MIYLKSPAISYNNTIVWLSSYNPLTIHVKCAVIKAEWLPKFTFPLCVC